MIRAYKFASTQVYCEHILKRMSQASQGGGGGDQIYE